MANLAKLPAESHLPLELRPRSEGIKGKVEYIRRLRVDVERSWPLFARAMNEAGLVRSVGAVAAALWEIASDSRPVTGNREEAIGRWAVIEERLAIELRDRGLPLRLAAARAGVHERTLTNRMRDDPGLGERVQAWRREGIANLHAKLHEQGLKGSETAIARLLEWSGEPEYTSKIRIQEPDEAEVLRSRAWQRIEVRLAGLLCAECRERVIAGMGER